jgi:uncharacterized protein YbjT (DUF2867 family)
MAGPVVVVGATGSVGRKVVAALVRRGVEVRALVRPGSDASGLDGPLVAIARGDMMDPASLDAAFAGADGVISSAAGYTRRRKTDTAETDVVGNRNLAEAAKRAGVRRFVLCSILTCDKARDVPHFWHKKLAEDALRDLGVPFVALRPGAFLDQSPDWIADGAKKGRFVAMGDRDTAWTYVLTADLAEALVAALYADGVDGRTIDLGWDRPVSNGELARLISARIGKPLKVWTVPWWAIGAMTRAAGVFNETARDLGAMVRWFRTGAYVADPHQAAVLGPVPTAEDAIARWAAAAGLT